MMVITSEMMMVFNLFVLLLTTGCLAVGSVRSCEPIKIKMCQGLGYTVTGRPNLVNNELQMDAQLQLQTFTPLIQYGCSKRLRFFLCSAYVPLCTEKVPDPIGPCRPLCEDVRDRCLPVLQQFGFPWPPALNCSKFPPENNHRHMCMPGPEPEDDRIIPVNPGIVKNPVYPNIPFKNPEKHLTTRKKPTTRPKFFTVNKPANPIRPVGINLQTPAPHPHTYNYGMCDGYKNRKYYYFVNRTGLCSHLCNADVLFTKDEKYFANIWVIVMAMFCFASTFVTFLTFVLDSSQIKFPERPIIFISLCFCLYSGAYLVRVIAGRDSVACSPEPQWQDTKLLTRDGLENSFCASIFVVTYYFGTASGIWWIVLCFSWLLSSGRKWSHEALDVRNSYFHLFSWGIPSILSVLAVVVHAIDADELTGMCSVGNHNSNHLLLFVIVPNLLFLVVGILIIIVGCFAMYRVRHNREPYRCAATRASERMESHNLRLAFFFAIYIVSSFTTIGTYFYEYIYRKKWLTVKGEDPQVWVFILKISMCMIVGTLSGIIIWTNKIVATWKNIARRKRVNRTFNKPQVCNTTTATTHHHHHHLSKNLVVKNYHSKHARSKSGGETCV